MAFSREIYSKLEAIVGRRNISEDPVVLQTYRCAAAQSSAHFGPYSYLTPTPQAVVLPGSTEEVQRIVQVCNEYKIKFKASTTFWSVMGYIGDDYSLQLDMRRMRKIEIDEKNMIAIVEPYAIGATIQAEAMKHGLSCAITGAGCSGSVLASTIGHQGGGPSSIYMGTNYDNMLAAEFVLPDGSIMHTGSMAQGAGWFCGDGPGPSLRALVRGGTGTNGEMGVCTKMAIKLSAWPGPKIGLPVRGLPPAYKADLPENFRAYTLCFPDWIAWANAYMYFYDNEIIYLGHRQFNMFGRDLKGAMVNILTDPDGQLADIPRLVNDPYIKQQTEDMKIDVQIVIAGMSENDLAWKEAVLDEILKRVGGHKNEMMSKKDMEDYTLSYLIRMGHKNLNYVYCGAYEGNMAWSSNVYIDAEYMEQVVAMKKEWEDAHDYFAKVGGDSGLGSLTRVGGGGSTGFEFFLHFDAHDRSSVKGTCEYIDHTAKWMKDHGFGMDLGRVNANARRSDGYSFTQEEHNAMFRGTPMEKITVYQYKLREALNPNNLSGSYYRTCEPRSNK